MADQKTDQAALDNALELLHFGYRAFIAEDDAILAERGLGRVHHRILYFVARDPGQRVGTLRTTLGISKQALHGPLRELQQSALIHSEPHPEDGRSRALNLTASGRTLERQLTRVQHDLMARVFADNPGAIAGWQQIMGTLAALETDRLMR